MGVYACHYADEDDRALDVDRRGRTAYPSQKFFAETDDPYQSGGGVLVECQDIGGRRAAGGRENIPVPYIGDFYYFYRDTDVSSFVSSIKVRLRDAVGSKTQWEIDVAYSPLEAGESRERQENQNPLNHPPEYWIEWVEEEAPIELAYCMTNLPQIKRGPRFRFNEPGPPVNACGVQTVDPITRKVYHPVICSLRNVASLNTMLNVNANYQDTTNGDVYLGQRPRTWAYLHSTCDRMQSVYVDDRGLITYYPMTTKIQFRARTWDTNLVNNGFGSFQKKQGGGYIRVNPDNNQSAPALLAIKVKDRPASKPDDDEDEDEETYTSEPMNLRLDGTVSTPDERQTSIAYRHLRDAGYQSLGF